MRRAFCLYELVIVQGAEGVEANRTTRPYLRYSSRFEHPSLAPSLQTGM